ncbi:hypothetical protein DCC81_23510 [Chitinophaga parva]|uniref:Uncharacterized protein n=1 Tax=Chitinophaga parva TaxID=2169414 RepID=A0A2T7BE53_9BACT|nr:hypothetical protein [Chitinophaga parva]PUZ23355.1 hypothetical protein DCC81_23510 [Chitinophaga parva]
MGKLILEMQFSLDGFAEMHFLVNPAALGKGLRIFHDLTQLALVKATGFACGVTALHYRLQ